jgi:hypothetical protein
MPIPSRKTLDWLKARARTPNIRVASGMGIRARVAPDGAVEIVRDDSAAPEDEPFGLQPLGVVATCTWGSTSEGGGGP